MSSGPKNRWPPQVSTSHASIASSRTPRPRWSMRAWRRTAGADRFPRRPWRRQQHGYGQGLQFPAHQRRADGRLLGRRQGHPAHAAADRHPHDGRDGQRMPVLRPDHPPPNPCENGLRRSQSGGPGGDPRSRVDAHPASGRGCGHGHGCAFPRPGNGRHAAAEPDLADALPRGVPPLCPRAETGLRAPAGPECPGRRAPGGGLGRHGHREQHAGGGPRGGQSAHGPLWRRSMGMPSA